MIALVLLLGALPAIDPPGVEDPAAERAWEAASAERRAGRAREAVQAFEALATRHPTSRRAVQALAAAGTLARWELGDTARAKQLWIRALDGPSDVPGSDGALNELLALARDEGGAEGELALVRQLAPRRTRAEYAPRLWVRAAEILIEAGRPKEAVEAAHAAILAAGEGTWWDDARMIEGRAYLAAGDHDAALRSFRAIMGSHRTILIGGDENSDHLDDAYFMEAVTLERAGRIEEAERAYFEVADEKPDSVLVDDALDSAHRLALARKDADAAARALKLMRKLTPESRFLRGRSEPVTTAPPR